MPEVRLIDANALEQFYESGTDPLDTYADMTYIRAEHIENAPAVNRWIPVEDALPEKSGEYLVYTEYEDVFKCYFEKENDPEEDECQWGFYQDYRDPDTLGWAGTTWTAVETVTHWMPLPEPPESEAQDEPQ